MRCRSCDHPFQRSGRVFDTWDRPSPLRLDFCSHWKNCVVRDQGFSPSNLRMSAAFFLRTPVAFFYEYPLRSGGWGMHVHLGKRIAAEQYSDYRGAWVGLGRSPVCENRNYGGYPREVTKVGGVLGGLRLIAVGVGAAGPEGRVIFCAGFRRRTDPAPSHEKKCKSRSFDSHRFAPVAQDDSAGGAPIVLWWGGGAVSGA